MGFAALLALALAACRPGQGGAPEGHAAPAFKAVPPAWGADRFDGHLTAVRSEAHRIVCDLILPAGSAMPAFPVGFNFCLPGQTSCTLRILRYAVGSQVVQALNDAGRLTSGTAELPRAVPRDLVLQPKGILRDRAIGALVLYPTFFDPWQRLQGLNPRDLTATFEIAWPATTASPAAPPAPPAAERGMAQVQRHLVANPQDLDRWPVKSPPWAKELNPMPTDPRPLAPDAGSWFRFRVAADGLCRLDGAALARAGIKTPGALARVRIFSEGHPVPLYRVRQAAGGDAVLFYGWKSRTPYDPQQVYWLTLSDKAADAAGAPADPALLQGAARPLATLHKLARIKHENVRKVLHEPEFMQIIGVDWLDAALDDARPIPIPFALAAPAPLAGQPILKARLRFYADGNPELWTSTTTELRHGSTRLARIAFNQNDTSFERTADLPSSVFASGPTTLTLTVTRSTTATLAAEDDPNREGIWLESAELAYEGFPSLEGGRCILNGTAVTTTTSATLFRLALPEPGIPARADLFALAVNPSTRQAGRLPLEGRQLTFPVRGPWHAELYDLAGAASPTLESIQWPDDLLASAGADVLVVTHAMFLDTLKPLLEDYARRGLKARAVDVQRLYDLFGDGMLTPAAIRNYLGYLAAHGPGLPQYLLLFGDCSEDYLNVFRSSVRNLVPSRICHEFGENWSSDMWYSLIRGDDILPDLIVSRISVNNLADARAAIGKTLRYGKEKLFGPWRARFSIVADNLQDYRAMAEKGRRYIPPEIETPRIYLDELPLEDNWYVMRSILSQLDGEGEESMRKVSSAATNAIRNLFTSGTQVLEYLGHGSPNLWAHERIWFGGGSPNRDSQYLKPNGRCALIFNFTCFTGKIDYPLEPWNICIAEDLLRTTDSGAIALFAPSGLGSPALQEVLIRHLHDALFGDRIRGVGELITLVRARSSAMPTPDSHLKMYELLGDPTVELQMVRDWRQLTVNPEIAQPGLRSVDVSLDAAAPARGQAQLWLETKHGDILWESPPFDYQGGAIRQSVKLPEGLTSPQRLRLALYAWNEKENRDLLAAGWLNLERPTVVLNSAGATRTGRGYRFEIELQNLSRVASEPFKLRVDPAPATPGGAPLAEDSFTLDAGERRRVELKAPAPPTSPGAPACFEAVLQAPHPPDDPAQPFPPRRRFSLPPSGNWTGWVPALGKWLNHPNGEDIVLCALSERQPAGSLIAVARGASGDVLTTFPLTFNPRGETFICTATLAGAKRGFRPSDSVDLVQQNTSAAPKRLDRMALADLPRLAPTLRLVPKSITNRPESPTDGETVFVSFSVANEGSALSGATFPALLTRPLFEGGSPLPYRSGLDAPQIPALGPGRVWPVTLRWDPNDDAGVQTIYIDANPVNTRSTADAADQSASHKIYVRTKSMLARGRWLPALRSKDDQGRTVYKLRVEVLNGGETDAHNIEVYFYRTAEKDPAGRLGVILLPVVPAKGVALAQLDGCRLNEATDKPVVEIRIKGSAQTITE